jgi:hypothetical protein
MIAFTVCTPGEIVSISEKIVFKDKDQIYLTGIAVSSTEGAYLDSVFRKFHLNSEEIFPTDFAVKLLLGPLNIEPQNRFYPLKINFKTDINVEIEYKDANSKASYPYDVRIYLRLEI